MNIKVVVLFFRGFFPVSICCMIELSSEAKLQSIETCRFTVCCKIKHSLLAGVTLLTARQQSNAGVS